MKAARESEERILSRMQTCVHFNGIMHEVCCAGVNYKALAQTNNLPQAQPCLLELGDPNNHGTCQKAVYPSRAEAVAAVEVQEERLAERLAQLEKSVCPVCRQSVRQRQVGSCVYGTCGHRLFQGRVNPEFKESE